MQTKMQRLLLKKTYRAEAAAEEAPTSGGDEAASEDVQEDEFDDSGGYENPAEHEDLLDTDDEEFALEDDVTEEVTEEAAAEETPPEETPTEGTPPAEEEPAVEDVVAPTETPATEEETPDGGEEAAATPPEVDETPQPTATEVAEQRKEMYAAAEVKLTEHYTLTEDEAAELETDAAKALPKMAAKMHMAILEQATTNIAAIMPQMVHQMANNSQKFQAAEGEFYTSWPQLNKPEYGETLARVGATYRQLNPHATKEQAQKEIGLQAMVALGLPLVPDAVVEEVLEDVTTSGAHTPAVSGGVQQPTKPVSQNPFEKLAEEFEEED